ncbi:hypothetical protein MKW94_010117 [Papaver nudicaule]|uniref:Response regulatory domain-containing protein n=1 Tax=Papaver nudicaule TaxID=74823 RepID=A0AA41VWV4_PAPNU|nr:hypothetical protein [Papaver nudicaule]
MSAPQSNSGNNVPNGVVPMNPTALVVEDDRMTRMIHSYHLRALGFQTREAENGQVAVQLLESGMRYDVILMDYEMPIMNGAEATKRIRDMGIQSAILGVSDIDDENVRASFVRSGLTDLFSKPLARDMLIPYTTSV